jgi:hypothetical protein
MERKMLLGRRFIKLDHAQIWQRLREFICRKFASRETKKKQSGKIVICASRVTWQRHVCHAQVDRRRHSASLSIAAAGHSGR